MRFRRSDEDGNLTAGVRFLKTEQTATAVYHVYGGPDQRSALDFLRRNPVKEELVYHIVETPEGNLGRDLIYIFRESDGSPIELGSRPRSRLPTPSDTLCAWCGHFVRPRMIAIDDRVAGDVHTSYTHDELRNL